MIADAWAVRMNGHILTPTVAATRRAAIINWLFVYAQITVTNDWYDQQVEFHWENIAKRYRAEVIEVIVTEKPDA